MKTDMAIAAGRMVRTRDEIKEVIELLMGPNDGVNPRELAAKLHATVGRIQDDIDEINWRL